MRHSAPDPRFIRLLLTVRLGGYIAIAARTLGRCATDAFILPETLGEAGLVMM